MKLALAAVLVAFAGHVHDAGANSACGGESGWSSEGAVVAPHPRVVFWMNGRSSGPSTVVAKIDGKVVKTNITTLVSSPNELVTIEIQSDAKGALTLDWKNGLPAGHYTIKATTAPKVAHATTSRYHSKLAHSTVREVFDGLAIKLDVPAMRAHVKLRRDAKSDWRELDVPVDKDHTIRIGELGCASNYEPQLLENGVDLDVALVLADGSSIPIEKLTHAFIAKLAKPTSPNPWDAE
jgi:hypothetical protein